MQGGLTSVLLGELEVGHPLLAEGHVPPHLDVLLGLALLQSLVVVRLQLDQRAEYVLVLVGILVAEGGREEGRGRREGGREGWREGGKKRGREGERKRGKKWKRLRNIPFLEKN